jgi:hypothetical protein
MSDYFFQQPDEEEKREYLRMELERMQREAQMNGAQPMPVPPSSNKSPSLSPNQPTPIEGLSSPDLGPEMPKKGPFDMLFETALDFTPVVGDVKGFMEAQSPMDYAFATAGLFPVVGDSLKAAYKAKKAAEAQKRYERYQADTWTPGHRGIEDPQHAGARERMGQEFLDSDLPEYVHEIEPEDFEAMSPSMRRLWKALERDDFLGFDRTDDLMSTLTKADEEMLIENFDLSPQLKSALGRYINEQYK